MASEQRKLLEQLMGSDIMGTPDKAQMSFKDPKVCRSFLCGDCPHDLFVNTKMDLGPCPKLHSDKLKADYDRWRPSQDIGFEFDLYDDLNRFVEDCDNRIDTTYRRLERTPEEITKSTELLKEMTNLENQIDALLDEAEIMISLGDVFGAVGKYSESMRLNVDCKEREREMKGLNDVTGNPNQKLQVCDVCGALLSRLDNDRRLADHFIGKLHQGYARMRVVVKDLKKKLAGKQRPMYDEGDRRSDRRYDARDDRRQDRRGGDRPRGPSRGGRRGRGGDGYGRY